MTLKFAGILLVVLVMASVFVKAQSSDADSSAKLVNAPSLRLSDEIIAAGIDGSLVVVLTVDDSGKAKNVGILAGPSWPCGKKPKKELDELREVVIANVSAAQFAPATRKGKPISTDVSLTFKIGEAYRKEQKKREEEKTGRLSNQIEGGVINGKALSLPKPAYPYGARSARASGAVSVQVLIDEQGKVIRAGAVSGHPALQEAARSAACDAKFSPTSLKGQPVKVSGVITYTFVP